jgi:predicted DNA-binding antitoxin AbrB/MazE fold protein
MLVVNNHAGGALMRPIEAIYENGVFRPLSPIELPEGARVEVIVIGPTQPGLLSGEAEIAEPVVGEELAALLDQIAELPYTPHPDGQTDVSSRHDDFLYPKQGKMP